MSRVSYHNTARIRYSNGVCFYKFTVHLTISIRLIFSKLPKFFLYFPQLFFFFFFEFKTPDVTESRRKWFETWFTLESMKCQGFFFCVVPPSNWFSQTMRILCLLDGDTQRNRRRNDGERIKWIRRAWNGRRVQQPKQVDDIIIIIVITIKRTGPTN